MRPYTNKSARVNPKICLYGEIKAGKKACKKAARQAAKRQVENIIEELNNLVADRLQ